MSQVTTTVLPSAAAVFTADAAPTFPAGYVEADPAERSRAKTAHLLGLFGIVGTGIYYAIKRSEAGDFARDQMKEAFNFHVLVFASAIALCIVGAIAAAIIGLVGMVISLFSTVLVIGALVLSILNAMKAGNGQVVRYPARIRVLK